MKEAIHPNYGPAVIKCACGEVIAFDEETLEEGSIVCENCGETLEFSFDDEDEEEYEDEE